MLLLRPPCIRESENPAHRRRPHGHFELEPAAEANAARAFGTCSAHMRHSCAPLPTAAADPPALPLRRLFMRSPPPLAGIGSETLGRAPEASSTCHRCRYPQLCAKNEPCTASNSSGRPFSVCRIRAPGDSIAKKLIACGPPACPLGSQIESDELLSPRLQGGTSHIHLRSARSLTLLAKSRVGGKAYVKCGRPATRKAWSERRLGSHASATRRPHLAVGKKALEPRTHAVGRRGRRS